MNHSITSSAQPPLSTADTLAKRHRWWVELEPQWQTAFQMAFFGHARQPTDEELQNLGQTPVLRFVGPLAPYPNLDFALTNCSGLRELSCLETLVLTHHRVESIRELTQLTQLKSLFINDNAIRSLSGIEGLIQLEQLYTQANQIGSFEPVRSLTQLREVYAHSNALKTLDGFTRKHADSLKAFFCLPNAHLPDREIIRFERNFGIRCRSL